MPEENAENAGGLDDSVPGDEDAKAEDTEQPTVDIPPNVEVRIREIVGEEFAKLMGRA